MEKPIRFKSQKIELEGLYCPGSKPHSVVVTHPHPLYGGDMHNHVVTAITQAYQRLDCSTLRFNLRGVGRSQGNYDEGLAEQEDVVAAIAYLNAAGLPAVDLVGYSFGAWVNARVASRCRAVRRLVMVSPPVAFLDFQEIRDIASLKLVITGDRDDIAPADRIARDLPFWNPAARFEIIKGADHFYGGHLNDLKAILTA
jgi:alpha/beta superfamily hydrolase